MEPGELREPIRALGGVIVVKTLTMLYEGRSQMEFDWTQGALAEGLRRYNTGEYFTAHEAWETVWLKAHEPDKTFLQGLIQVAAAFHHLQRNNPVGTGRLLHAALRRLEVYPACFGGISVTTLCSDIRNGIQALHADAPTLELARARILPVA